MSEQARLFILQKRLNDTKKTRRLLTISIILIAVILGVLGNLVGMDFLVVLTLAVGLMVVGLFMDSQYAKQEATILWEMQQTATFIPKCPSCGKDIPKGNSIFVRFAVIR